MADKIGEKFIEGRIISLDNESIVNLENLLEKVSKKEEKVRDDIDKSIGTVMGS